VHNVLAAATLADDAHRAIEYYGKMIDGITGGPEYRSHGIPAHDGSLGQKFADPQGEPFKERGTRHGFEASHGLRQSGTLVAARFSDEALP
jgi:hypothetical protein